MFSTTPFEIHAQDYDNWFDKYKIVFESELSAVKELMPQGNLRGIEVGLGTGRFAASLGIKEGIEPALEMRKLAKKRGLDVKDAIAEKLPYGNDQFDFVLMVSCISYFTNLAIAFQEANRVLKTNAYIIVGFIDKNSLIGQYYISKREKSIFYRNAVFYSAEQILNELKRAGFLPEEMRQTLFENLDEIIEHEISLPGHGRGSFVVIKAIKDK